MSDPMIIRARVPAPVKEVRHALTDPAVLRVWLAEHVEVELPDRYEFWGRYTPEGDAPHQRLLHADDHTVRFAWTLDGVETTTEFAVAEDGPEATIVSVSQTHFDMSEAHEDGVRGMLQTFWYLVLANLVEHFEGRPLTPRPDFTSAELRAEVLIDAAPEKVYGSLIDSESVTRWFGYPIEIEPHVGGRYAMGGLDSGGEPAKILELETDRRLSVDWGSVGVATWELEGTGGKTRLTMFQSGFDRTPYAAWLGSVAGLADLRRFNEMPDWSPIWLA
ncbi:SRPBCC family protein [Nonomuraea sp. LPB2021202275-12-8]|uniref:SRPBCC family protein n=1 Tax=Nonomuraea sp. LPB2021202275-12-8 TaxID=3120159 RepID=UPI00300C0875